MLLVLPFCRKDKHQAIRLAEWIRDLGGVQDHDCLLTVAQSTSPDGVIEPLREAFKSVEVLVPYEDSDEYPQGATLLWLHTARHIADSTNPQPWLWIEPDAVPLKSSWLNDFESEYKRAGKPFMHDLVITPTSRHNSGCGVYPALVRDYTSRMIEVERHTWDVFLSPEFMPFTHHTELLQDVFWMNRKPDIQPTFTDTASLSIIDPRAVVYHRNKDGTLIKILRSNGVVGDPRTGEHGPTCVDSGRVVPNETKAAKIIYTYFEPIAAISASQ
jgi:hypothetical protein